jgi:hypothetical protein
LLDRILAVPQLAHVVPRLQPEVLHRVVQQCGLEECGPLVALATPGQLARVFDLDLWRPAAHGREEQFDGNRFGAWLEVMVEADVSGAATTLAAMDVDLIAAGFVEHVRVFDAAAVAPYVTLDGDVASTGIAVDDTIRYEVGGFLVSAKSRAFWDAMTAVLSALAEVHAGAFNRIMRRCCRLSNSRPEVDGLDDLLGTNEQAMFDLALDREGRRTLQGYVTPAQARAFLQTSRRIDLREGALPPRDPMTHAHFTAMEAQDATDRDEASPRRVSPDRVEAVEVDAAASADAIAALVGALNEAGATRAPRALLDSPEKSVPRLSRVRAHLRFVHDRDADVFAMRNAELAYLANVMIAGSTIQSRPIAEQEASNAAVAICNLGLENWPVQWLAGEIRRGLSTASVVELPEDFLIRHDLVSVFQVGWTVLHEDVCMYAADRLINVLSSLRCADRDVHVALGALRVRLMRHWRAGSPWNAREALDPIAMLDAPSWAALAGLIDEFPTLHAAVGALLGGTAHQVDASRFEFISENTQVQQVHDFLQLLPHTLAG